MNAEFGFTARRRSAANPLAIAVPIPPSAIRINLASRGSPLGGAAADHSANRPFPLKQVVVTDESPPQNRPRSERFGGSCCQNASGLVSLCSPVSIMSIMTGSLGQTQERLFRECRRCMMSDPDQARIEDFNRRQWVENHQDFKYFGEHPDYGHPESCESLLDDTSYYESTIRHRYQIDPADRIVCEIGIGYGRLSANFKTARHIYGIDVSQELFQTTARYLGLKGFSDDRFTLLLSDDYKNRISSSGDFVFSLIVFQHIPKSFQVDYLRFFAGWLNPGGTMLIQFLVADMPDAPEQSEPRFCWRVSELYELVRGLSLVLTRFDVEFAVPGDNPCYWAWVHLKKP
jgi:hypothetical protein